MPGVITPDNAYWTLTFILPNKLNVCMWTHSSCLSLGVLLKILKLFWLSTASIKVMV